MALGTREQEKQRLQTDPVCNVTHLSCFSGLDETARPCAALFFLSSSASSSSLPVSPTRTPLLSIISISRSPPPLLFGLFVTVSVTAPVAFFFFSFFPSVISVTSVACSAGCSPVLAAERERERERNGRESEREKERESKGPVGKRGRETSLAAVIGQEVGCLDVRALLSLSLPPPLPLGSQFSCVFASICSPSLSLSLSLSPLSSLSFSLNWPHRGVDHGPGRLDTSLPLWVSPRF